MYMPLFTKPFDPVDYSQERHIQIKAAQGPSRLATTETLVVDPYKHNSANLNLTSIRHHHLKHG